MLSAFQGLGVSGVNREVIVNPDMDHGGLRAGHAQRAITTRELTAFSGFGGTLHTNPHNAQTGQRPLPVNLICGAAQENLVDNHRNAGAHCGGHPSPPSAVDLQKPWSCLDPAVGEEANALVDPVETGWHGVEQHVKPGAQPRSGKNRLQAPGNTGFPGTRAAVEKDDVTTSAHAAIIWAAGLCYLPASLPGRCTAWLVAGLRSRVMEPRPVHDRVLTVPNVLSALRLALVPVFLIVLLVVRSDAWAVAILMFSGFSDWADGKIARLMNQSSKLGVLLDPAVDRLYMVCVPIGLGLRGMVPWWIVLTLLARDVLLAVMLPMLRSRGLSALPVTYIGKAATFGLMSGFPLILLGQWDASWSRVALACGWAFLIWGVGMYLWAFVLYVVQAAMVMLRMPKVPKVPKHPTVDARHQRRDARRDDRG